MDDARITRLNATMCFLEWCCWSCMAVVVPILAWEREFFTLTWVAIAAVWIGIARMQRMSAAMWREMPGPG